MKKIAVLIVGILLVSPVFVFATLNTTEELQSQIAYLLKLVAELQSKLGGQTGSSGGACHTFNTDLKIGDQNEEVSFLLTALARDGVATPRSTNFSHTYDEIMASYVSAFQEKYRSEILTPAGLSSPSGYFGARTRAKLNQLYGCNNTTNPILVDCPQISPLPPTFCVGGTITSSVNANGCRSYGCTIPTNPPVCTSDAKLCPDGSYVSRTGPKCEFAACPTSSTQKLSITTPSPLPNGKVDFTPNIHNYRVVLNVLPDSMPTNQLSWSVSSGSLPPGLYLTASDVGQIITGTPTMAGNFNFTITASSNSQTTSKQFTLKVDSANSTQIPTITGIESKASLMGTVYANEEAYIYGTGLSGPLTIKIGNQEPQYVYVTGISDTYAKFIVPSRTQSAVVSVTVTNSSGQTSNFYQVNINVPTPTNGTLSFSKSSFGATYIQGTPLPDTLTGSPNVYTNTQYLQDLTFTNTSNVNVNFKISVPNKPSWLNTSYSTDQLTLGPGQLMGLGAYLNPTTVANAPGTYTTNIILSGNFIGSPLSIPVTLNVVSSNSKTY